MIKENKSFQNGVAETRDNERRKRCRGGGSKLVHEFTLFIAIVERERACEAQVVGDKTKSFSVGKD